MSRFTLSSLAPSASALGVAGLALLALSACARVEGAVAASSPALDDLASLEELGSAFDEQAGAPRVVLLLSPT